MRAQLEPVSFGTGLCNVSARLFAAYNGKGTITIGPDPVCGTRAELNLPAAVKYTSDAAEYTN